MNNFYLNPFLFILTQIKKPKTKIKTIDIVTNFPEVFKYSDKNPRKKLLAQ